MSEGMSETVQGIFIHRVAPGQGGKLTSDLGGPGTFLVSYVGRSGGNLVANFSGNSARERAEDYKEALELLFLYTEPGTKLVDVLHYAFFHKHDGDEEEALEGDKQDQETVELR